MGFSGSMQKPDEPILALARGLAKSRSATDGQHAAPEARRQPAWRCATNGGDEIAGSGGIACVSLAVMVLDKHDRQPGWGRTMWKALSGVTTALAPSMQGQNPAVSLGDSCPVPHDKGLQRDTP